MPMIFWVPEDDLEIMQTIECGGHWDDDLHSRVWGLCCIPLDANKKDKVVFQHCKALGEIS